MAQLAHGRLLVLTLLERIKLGLVGRKLVGLLLRVVLKNNARAFQVAGLGRLNDGQRWRLVVRIICLVVERRINEDFLFAAHIGSEVLCFLSDRDILLGLVGFVWRPLVVVKGWERLVVGLV
jgi:hypothetical protein